MTQILSVFMLFIIKLQSMTKYFQKIIATVWKKTTFSIFVQNFLSLPNFDSFRFLPNFFIFVQMFHLLPKIEILVKNRHFRQNSKFWTTSEILVENPIVWSKIKFSIITKFRLMSHLFDF